MLAAVSAGAAQQPPYTIVGDAIPVPLAAPPGDPVRGRAIIVNRQLGLCLLCHSGPFPEEKLQGTLAPSLAGAGSRSSVGQLACASSMPATSIPTPSCRLIIAPKG